MLHEIQKTLNSISNQIEAADAETKWAALEVMLASSAGVVAFAKTMAKPDTKTVTRTIFFSKTKVIKQPVQETCKPAAKDASQTAFKTISSQNPLSNQQGN